MTGLPQLHKTAAVAEALQVTKWWLFEQVKAGVVSPMRVGRGKSAQLRWSDGDVQQLVDALRAEAPVAPVRRRPRRRAAS